MGRGNFYTDSAFVVYVENPDYSTNPDIYDDFWHDLLWVVHDGIKDATDMDKDSWVAQNLNREFYHKDIMWKWYNDKILVGFADNEWSMSIVIKQIGNTAKDNISFKKQAKDLIQKLIKTYSKTDTKVYYRCGPWQSSKFDDKTTRHQIENLCYICM